MEELLSFALSGIYSLLLLSLTFNFLLAIRLHVVQSKVDEAEERSLEEARLLEERLKKVKEEIVHRKGLVI